MRQPVREEAADLEEEGRLQTGLMWAALADLAGEEEEVVVLQVGVKQDLAAAVEVAVEPIASPGGMAVSSCTGLKGTKS